MQVREAKLADLEEIFTVEKSLVAEESYPLFVLRQLFDISPGLMKVAEAEGTLAGYILGSFVPEEAAGWVLSLAVLPPHQGKHLGYLLLSALLTDLAQKGARHVYLTVHPGNAPALQLYRKVGFTEKAKEENYYLTGSPRILMVWPGLPNDDRKKP